MNVLLVVLLVGAAYGQHDTNFATGHAGVVHLFEWHWSTIADECETFLGPRKFGAVQISPPTENRIVDSRPWWERYQPVSYILDTRSGDRTAFEDMVDRCNAVGVRIYADVIINHMCGGDGNTGYGTGGSYFDAINEDFPSVPYTASDFNDAKCSSGSGNIENYGDANQVRNCRLVNLLDLNQETDYVRGKISEYMNDLISLGVAGFRVDACKHMWPGDLNAIFSSLSDLSTSKGFEGGARPFVVQEVIDQGGEPITAGEYFDYGRVTEFKYGIQVSNNKYSPENLNGLGEDWGLMPDNNALVFLNNHDNQRGHGGGGSTITFDDPNSLNLFTGYMMAYPYGVPRIMSSYYFSNTDEGPPANQRTINADGSCGNGWVCEHRWTQIRNLASFAAAVQGQPLTNWQGSSGKAAFSRSDKGFIAIARNQMQGYYDTDMPDGYYCDIASHDFFDGQCTGGCTQVSSNQVSINVESNHVFAIHVNAECDCEENDCTTAPPTDEPPTTEPSNGDCTSCNSCSNKVDCGVVGTTQSECESTGCLWCPDYSGSNDPWCFYQGGNGGGNGGENGDSCTMNESSKVDCGYFGIDQQECESIDCCWAESNQSGVPWCYYKQ